MKAVVAAFNQEKALVGAFSVITNLRMELFQALLGRRLGGRPQTSSIMAAEKEARRTYEELNGIGHDHHWCTYNVYSVESGIKPGPR